MRRLNSVFQHLALETLNKGKVMNGYTLRTGILVRAPRAESNSKTSVRMAACSFSVMLVLALALCVSMVARAESNSTELSPAALPDSMAMMTGTVAITWTYRNKENLPFTEHHSITAAHAADALNRNGPVRVPANDSGELLINTANVAPGVILSARRYTDWMLVSVLRHTDNPVHSVGVFKFCSTDDSAEKCVNSILNHPDGTVTMTAGSKYSQVTGAMAELDSISVKDELVALLTL